MIRPFPTPPKRLFGPLFATLLFAGAAHADQNQWVLVFGDGYIANTQMKDEPEFHLSMEACEEVQAGFVDRLQKRDQQAGRTNNPMTLKWERAECVQFSECGSTTFC